ncbi:hypothetical protein I4F81_010685 [Pyropia yezoensis]|uniref:Uncharacterized protein n=1 Tax=Pyropia yezoensis TaxID=2788 RepID=A0ACC3CEI5_PYRYE|nr:hypothetical protein I4F81_010685 [Neopyropia yezoensis]
MTRPSRLVTAAAVGRRPCPLAAAVPSTTWSPDYTQLHFYSRVLALRGRQRRASWCRGSGGAKVASTQPRRSSYDAPRPLTKPAIAGVIRAPRYGLSKGQAVKG